MSTELRSHSDPDFKRAQRRVMGAVMFCYLFYYTGRQNFGFAIPGISEELGLTKAQLGWCSSALLWSRRRSMRQATASALRRR